MNFRSFGSFGLIVLVVAALGQTTAVAGPVQIDSQDRRVTARLSPERGAAAVTDEEVAPDAGPFVATALAEVDIDGFDSEASASVDSTLAQSGLSFAGSFRYAVTDTRPGDDGAIPTARLDYDFDVTFTIDEAYNYDFQDRFDRVNDDSSVTVEFLAQIDGVDVPFTDIDANGGGTLQPGTYKLTLAAFAEGLLGASSDFQLDYETTLDLSPSDGDGGGGGTPIPLPPAVWSGLLLLGAGALGRLRKRW